MPPKPSAVPLWPPGGGVHVIDSRGSLAQPAIPSPTKAAVASKARTRPPDDEAKGQDLIIMGDVS